MHRLAPVLAAIAVLLTVVVLVQLVVRSQTGPLALVSVVEVHLLTVAAIAAVLALLGTLGGDADRRRTRLALLAVVVIAFVRLGGELWSPAVEASAATRGEATGSEASEDRGAPFKLDVLTWNLELGSKSDAVTVEGITSSDPDLVVLQELTPGAAAAIEADDTLRSRYPYRILEPRDGVDGMGVLARLPLLVRQSTANPLILRAGLLLPDGRVVEILDVHPYPPGIERTLGVPTGLDTRGRETDLMAIRAAIDDLELPGSALVAGDFNAVTTEPGMGVFDDGLADAHATAGSGPGFTWRPSRLEETGLALLRIDHVLAGDWLQPVAAATECSLPGDHCRLLVTLRVESVAP